MQTLFCSNDNNIKPELVQYINGHGWYNTWIENKLQQMRNPSRIQTESPKEYNIYSDGSKKEETVAGGIWIVEKEETLSSFKVAATDINDAEAIALTYACLIPEPGSKVTIYVDNLNEYRKANKILKGKMSAKNWSKDGNIATTMLMEEVIQIQLRRNVKINIIKVKAHTGVEGNERADQHAKYGLVSDFTLYTDKDKQQRKSEYYLTEDNGRVINNLFKKNIKEMHERSRKNEENEEKNRERLFYKIKEERYDTRWSYMHTESLNWKESWFRLIYRIRENNLPNAVEMFSRNDKNFKDTICKACRQGEETNEHIFLECTAYEDLRKKLHNKVFRLLAVQLHDDKIENKIENWFNLKGSQNNKIDKLAGMAGYLPLKVTKYIYDKSKDKDKGDELIRSILEVIVETTHNIWKERNKLWKKIQYLINKETKRLLQKMARRHKKRREGKIEQKQENKKKKKKTKRITTPEEISNDILQKRNEMRKILKKNKKNKHKPHINKDNDSNNNNKNKKEQESNNKGHTYCLRNSTIESRKRTIDLEDPTQKGEPSSKKRKKG